jgi:hypothetical protein
VGTWEVERRGRAEGISGKRAKGIGGEREQRIGSLAARVFTVVGTFYMGQ